MILSLFYFTVFLPYGVGARLLMDRLQLRPATPAWSAREPGEPGEPGLPAARRQS